MAASATGSADAGVASQKKDRGIAHAVRGDTCDLLPGAADCADRETAEGKTSASMTGYAIAPFTRRPLQTSCPRRWTARTILGTVSSSSHYPDVCPNFPKSNPCAAESHPAWCVRESTPWIFDVQICAGRFRVVSPIDSPARR